MKVELKPEHQAIIDRAVESGAFNNTDEALEYAFASVQEKTNEIDWLARDRDYVRAKVSRGFEQAERGELIPEEEVEAILERRWNERERLAGR